MAELIKTVELARDVKKLNTKHSPVRPIIFSGTYHKLLDYDDDDILFVEKYITAYYTKIIRVEKVHKEFISKNLVKEELEYEELPEDIKFATERYLYIKDNTIMNYSIMFKQIEIAKKISQVKESIVISKTPTEKQNLIPGRWYVFVYKNEELNKVKHDISRYVLCESDEDFSYVVSCNVIRFSEKIFDKYFDNYFDFHLVYDKEKVIKK